MRIDVNTEKKKWGILLSDKDSDVTRGDERPCMSPDQVAVPDASAISPATITNYGIALKGRSYFDINVGVCD